MELDSKEKTIDTVDELIEQYESLDEEKLDFMAEQDVSMKLTTLKSVREDIKRFA